MKDSLYIIAEIGNTHEGSVGLAKKFIDTAKEVGADAVKFQTHLFEYESTENAPSPEYFKLESRQKYFKRTSFNIEEWLELKNYAEKKVKIDFLSSPFSLEAVELLETLDIKIFKIPSGEVTNVPLLEKIASLNKPVFLSTGMSTYREIDNAINIFKSKNCKDLTIMQCTSDYPCMPERSGLNIIDEFKEIYPELKIGFSDHTEGMYASLAALTKGAKTIEKHLTLSKKMYGSDAIYATEPLEFRKLCSELRKLDSALNSKLDKDEVSSSLNNMKNIFEKSIVFAKNLKKGEKITKKNIAFKKPGDGLKPKEYTSLIGKILKKGVKKNQKVKMNDFINK